MSTKIETFLQPFLKKDLLDIRTGDTIRVYQKVLASTKATKGKKEESKEKIQTFEGLVIARKHGKGISATLTVRKVIAGMGVEKIFPIHLPSIEKIEILKRGKVRRAKLYYLRKAKGKKTRLKREEFAEVLVEEKPGEEVETEEISEAREKAK